MKILVVCTTDSMVWSFLLPHIEGWREKGNQVDVACSRTGFYFDEIKDQYGIKITEIPFERFPFKFRNISAFIQLYSLVKKEKYDCIVSQEPVGGVIGRLTGRLLHCRNVYTAHGFHFFKGASFTNWLLFYPVENFFSRFTDALVTINSEDYERAKTFHAKKVYLIHGIGVDLGKYNQTDDLGMREFVRNELGITKDSFVIITTAEMIPRKNYKTALSALSQLNFRDFVYLICGDGALKQELAEQAKALGIFDRVKFLGFRKDVDRLYKASDMFLLTSFQEGLSVSLMEAMSSGLPIVCSKIRGNTDLIIEGKGGFLYHPKDVDGIAKGIELIRDGKGKGFGKFNRNNIQRYSIDNSKKEFYRILTQLE